MVVHCLIKEVSHERKVTVEETHLVHHGELVLLLLYNFVLVDDVDNTKEEMTVSLLQSYSCDCYCCYYSYCCC